MRYETGGKFGSHQIGEFTDKCRCGATRNEVLDRIVNEFCPAAVDPKLIERVARAMCKADGNDPDEECTYCSQACLRGLARGANTVPSKAQIKLAWHLYAPAAETAILELEAAAVEPLPAANASGGLPLLPVERTPWHPPYLYCMAPDTGVFSVVRKEAATQQAATFSRPMEVTWSEAGDFTDWSAEACDRAKVHVISGKSASQIIVDDPNEPSDTSEAREIVNRYTGEMAAVHDRMHRAQDEDQATFIGGLQEVVKDQPAQQYKNDYLPSHPMRQATLDAFDRIFNEGIPVSPATPESESDPANPNAAPVPAIIPMTDRDEAFNAGMFDTAPTPKGAPLIEAIRRQREKDGF